MYRFGDNGVDVKLQNMRNTADIVWVSGNSYVRVTVPDSATEYTRQYEVHTSAAGEQYMIISVNGIGEIRWGVNNNWDLKYNAENKTVADYFFAQ